MNIIDMVCKELCIWDNCKIEFKKKTSKHINSTQN